jgi:hypothetical protein
MKKLYKLSVTNELSLNINKCQVIQFFLKRELIFLNYRLGNSILTRVDFIRNLGIIVEDNLSFSRQALRFISH